MNYEWNILHIKTKNYEGMPNTIHSARVEYIGTNEAGDSGTYELLMTFPKPDEASFIEYENLTYELMVEWFDAWIGAEDEHFNLIKNHIEYEIENKIIKRSTLPW